MGFEDDLDDCPCGGKPGCHLCGGVGRVKKGALEADRLLQKYTEEPEQILARQAEQSKVVQWVMIGLVALAVLIVWIMRSN